jgi:hypothetical protein
MSEKITVTVFRRPSCERAPVGSSAPHFEQNFAFGGFLSEQAGQRATAGV